MKIIDVQQGSAEWHAHRATHRNASDAPIMMGASKKVARNELLRLLSTGSEREYSQWTVDVLFARGHQVEALARPIAERIVGDDLFAIVGVHDDGRLSASFDGLTMCGRTGWECKQWNEEKASLVRQGEVPEEDYWQVVQQFHVSDAERFLYMVSDGTEERTVWCWVMPNKRDARSLLAGWDQFEKDLEAYVPPATVVTAVAEVQSLPSVSVEVKGAIAIVSNLPAFGVALKDFIAKIDMKPETDQAFAEAEAAVKTLEKAEEALDAAKASGLAQVATVDEMVRTVESMVALARTTRLALEKMVKSRKDEIRADIAKKARDTFTQYLIAQNLKFGGRASIVMQTPDFVGAMKGKRTISSLRSAVDDLLAKSKIAANEIADQYTANLATIDDVAKDHLFLCRDVADLVKMNAEHLGGVLRGRIAEHKAAEQKRLDEEREKIRLDEEKKAKAAADAEAEKARERIRDEERAKAQREVQAAPTPAPSVTPAPTPAPTPITASAPAARPAFVPSRSPAGFGSGGGLPRRAPVTIEQPAKNRPTDAEIIEVLALHYRVHESKVVEWLLAMDLTTASAALEKEFV